MINRVNIQFLIIIFYYQDNFQFQKWNRQMQTIIYTNSKRQGSNYSVDRIVFSQSIEINQLIENQMERYNITHIHFWFVRENVNRMDNAKEETLLVNIGKYLIENKDNNFKFQYIVEKYQENQEKKDARAMQCQWNFRNADLSDSMQEKISNKQEKTCLTHEEIIKQEIKFTHFKEFEIFIKKQLKSNLDEQIIKKYLFKTKDQTIGVSFFQATQKDLIHKIIEQDCNQIYNAKLHYRKISTIHPEDYQKNKKKMEEEPIQLYHRVILYLFTNNEKGDDNREAKRKKTFKTINPPPKNLSVEAIQAWKIEDQAQSLIKYEKQCELITQQIQNEKIIFRNKIKLIQNYIGDSINVEKLFQEEEQVQTTNLMIQQMNNTIGATPLKKMPILAKRSSITPAISQTITNNLEKISKYNSNLNNPSFLNISEFKRLKDISEAMRNIDNTIFEQNKKIQQLKTKAKELAKLKEEILFKNAKQFNAIKKQILQLTHEIERKENEIQEKKKNGQFLTYLQYKGKQPSQKAKQNLTQHIKFVSLHQKPQTFDQRDYLPSDYQETKEEEKSTNRSLHRKQFKEIINSSMLKFRQKKIKQAEATKQNVTNQQFKDCGEQITTFNTFPKYKTGQYGDRSTMSDLEKQLMQLYLYYQKNQELIKTIKRQTNDFMYIQQSEGFPTHTKKDSWLQKFSQSKIQKDLPFCHCEALLNLDSFPILKNLLSSENFDNEQLYSVTSSNKAKQYHAESLYPNDYFEMMVNIDKKKSLKKCTKDDSIRSSMKDTDVYRESEPNLISKTASPHSNLKATQNTQKNLIKASKFKRITIEEAISINSLMKKVRMHENYDHK